MRYGLNLRRLPVSPVGRRVANFEICPSRLKNDMK
jgi:hypothetical protein